ncbi:hypothetical protein BJ166DRAFT_510394 [Pestalotiopsis sp. NC0098]|nr:hypothetical protein BJ166DRAFT_510394 [Pestalotiopsis sp. NC0098]
MGARLAFVSFRCLSSLMNSWLMALRLWYLASHSALRRLYSSRVDMSCCSTAANCSSRSLVAEMSPFARYFWTRDGCDEKSPTWRPGCLEDAGLPSPEAASVAALVRPGCSISGSWRPWLRSPPAGELEPVCGFSGEASIVSAAWAELVRTGDLLESGGLTSWIGALGS